MSDSILAYRNLQNGYIETCIGSAVSGLHKGFVISPFHCNKDNFITITDLTPIPFDEINSKLYELMESYGTPPIPSQSTTMENYFHEVESIITELKDNPYKKTIACRQIVTDGKLNVLETFKALCENYPTAFVFMFYTPTSGAWIGASPELLLAAHDNTLHTYALAGTRPVDSDTDWDYKNILEHKIVADYLSDTFLDFGLTPYTTPLSTRRAGNVEHLFRKIWTDFPSETVPFQLSAFIEYLSPTPALCGMPKEESLERIERLENFCRYYYGGFCGIYENYNNFKFYVIIRSLNFSITHTCIFTGGGITCYSIPSSEWTETANKALGIQICLNYLNLNQQSGYKEGDNMSIGE